VIVAVDGKTGWNQQPGAGGASEVIDLRPEDLGTVDFERWREPELILLKAADPTAKLTPLPDETIDGRPHAVVRLASPVDQLGVAIYIDQKTKLVDRLTFTDGKQTQSDEFADYRLVNGVQIAFKRSSTTGGRLTRYELTKFELDPTIDASVFAKPAAAKKP
jgi:hypothetical protein